MTSAPPRRDPSSRLSRFGFVDDPESRRRRGERILRVLRAHLERPIEGLRLLDVGCSAGLITRQLATGVSQAIGIDADALAIAEACRLNRDATRLAFCVASGERLPFADGAFDAVVCNHVYEHVGDPLALMSEIRRVLCPGGVCYFAAGHRLQFIEPHYRLPLLSWLPRSVASRYLRATGRGNRYDESFLPPWRIGSLLRGFRRRRMVSRDMLIEPDRFLVEGRAVRALGWLARLPLVGWLVAWAAPTQIWLLWR